jgi:thioredoxin-related protein
MKTAYFITAILLTIGFASACKKVATTPTENYKVTTVNDDWTTAKHHATSTDKNILLMVHASWCNTCKTFIKDVLTDANLAAKVNNKMVFAIVDGEQGDGPNLQTTYAVSGFPTFIITDKNGNKLTSKSGGMTSEAFYNFIAPYLK